MSNFKTLSEAFKAGISAINGTTDMDKLKADLMMLYNAYQRGVCEQELNGIKVDVCNRVRNLGFFDAKTVIDDYVIESRKNHDLALANVPDKGDMSRVDAIGKLTLNYTRFREYLATINPFTLKDFNKCLDDHLKECETCYPDWSVYNTNLKVYCAHLPKDEIAATLKHRISQTRKSSIHGWYLLELKRILLDEPYTLDLFNNTLFHHLELCVMHQENKAYGNALSQIKSHLLTMYNKLKTEFPSQTARILTKRFEVAERDMKENIQNQCFMAGVSMHLQLLKDLPGEYAIEHLEQDFRTLNLLYTELNLNKVVGGSAPERTVKAIEVIKARQLQGLKTIKDREKAARLISINVSAQYDALARNYSETFLRHLVDCNKVLRYYDQKDLKTRLSTLRAFYNHDVGHDYIVIVQEHIFQYVELFEKGRCAPVIVEAFDKSHGLEGYAAFLDKLARFSNMTPRPNFRSLLNQDRSDCLGGLPVIFNRNAAEKFEKTEEIISEIRGALGDAYRMRNSVVRSFIHKKGFDVLTRLARLEQHISWLHTFEYPYTLPDIELCVYAYRSLCEAIGNFPGMLANQHIELVTLRAEKVFATFGHETLLGYIEPIRKENKERLAGLEEILSGQEETLKEAAKIEKFVLERFESWLDIFKINKPEVTIARFAHLVEESRTPEAGEDKIKAARQAANELFEKLDGQANLAVANLIRKSFTTVRKTRNQIISSFRVPSVESLGDRTATLLVLKDHLEWLDTFNCEVILYDFMTTLEDHLEFIQVAAGNAADVIQAHRFLITKRASELIKKFSPEVVSDIIYNRINATKTFENTTQTKHDQEILTEHIKWLEILKVGIIVKNRKVEEYKLIRLRDLLRYYIDDYSHYLADNYRPVNEVTAWREVCECETLNVIKEIKNFGDANKKQTVEYITDLIKKTDTKRVEFISFLNRLLDATLEIFPGSVRSLIEERLIAEVRELSKKRWINLLDGVKVGPSRNDGNMAENAILESKLRNLLNDLLEIKSPKLNELIDEQIEVAKTAKSGLDDLDQFHLNWWKGFK